MRRFDSSRGRRALTPEQTLVATSQAVWTSSGPYRIDAGTSSVAGPFGGGVWHDIALAYGSLWVTDFDADLVRRLDSATGRVQAVVRLPSGSAPAGVAGAAGSVWVATSANPDGGPISSLLRLGPDNRATARYALPPGFVAGGIAIAFGSFWLADLAHPRVIRVRLG